MWREARARKLNCRRKWRSKPRRKLRRRRRARCAPRHGSRKDFAERAPLARRARGIMNSQGSKLQRRARGQSLVETALMLPLLLLVVFNVVNLAYFFLVVINLTG